MPRSDAIRLVSNPPNPWHGSEIAWDELPPPISLHVHEDRTKQILARNESPDIPFRWIVNPYRGCYHGCAYCYARPSHQHLDFGAGTDFERQLVVKPDAPKLLRAAFDRRNWRGELIVFSGNTDCYQPLEVSYGLTRSCLEVCLAYRQPVGVITKSTLVERDASLLASLGAQASCHVTVSVPFFDPAIARAIEPYVPTPARRFETIRRLADAGVSVGVNVAPVIPGLSDDQIPAILQAAHEAGATQAAMILLRLPGVVAEVFERRLRAALPQRADRVMHQLAACRGGATNDPRFGTRMGGAGPRWEAIRLLFDATCERLGLRREHEPRAENSFQRPGQGRQLNLL